MNGEENNTGGILERLRNSPRAVSTVIVILIIAGAIFAFGDRDDLPEETVVDDENTTEVADDPREEADEDVEETDVADTEDPRPDDEPVPDDEQPVDEDVAHDIPEAEETPEAFVEVAAPGEGATHLARRSAANFLETNPAEFEVTNEHRVFIEDYIVKHTETGRLAVGEQVTISKEVVQQAIAASRDLTDAQLQNLERFSQRVDWSL